MLAEVDTQPLVFGANKNGADHVSAPVQDLSIETSMFAARFMDAHKEQKTAIMYFFMMHNVENREQDQSAGANDRKDNYQLSTDCHIVYRRFMTDSTAP